MWACLARAAHHLDVARGLRREHFEEGENDFQVEPELPRIVVEAGDFHVRNDAVPGTVDVIRRGRPGGVARALEAEQAVGADVGPEVDGFAAFGGGEPVVVVLFEGAVEDRAVGEADLRDAFGVDEQGFAAEVEVERHIRAFPGFGDFAADVEPAAIEFFAPAIADFGRVVGQGQPFLKRNRFLCDGDFRGERHALQNDFVGQAPVGFGNAVFVYVQIKMGHGTPARIRGK